MKKSNTAEKQAQNTQLKAMKDPPSQDIMKHDKRIDIDTEDIPGGQTPYATHKAGPVNKGNKPHTEEDMGLDVPGAELDDDEEIIGEEDEENNYYSLSDDDNHEEQEGFGTGGEGE